MTEDKMTVEPDGKLRDLATDLLATRGVKAAMDKREKELVSAIKELVDGVCLPDATTKFDLGGVELSRVPGMSASVSRDLLLERGVDPSIIDYATKRTAYFQWRVREVEVGS